MKNRYNRILTGTILAGLALSLAACHKKEEKSQGPEVVDVAMPTVDSVVLHKVLPGMIEASNSVDVVARVNGRLLSVNYNPGDYVRKGQVLFTIESTQYRDAVAQAQSSLSEAESNYAYYSKQYEAMKRALASDAVSQMDVNQAESNMKNAAASIQDAKARIESARTSLSYCTVTAPVSGHITDNIIDSGNVVSGEAAPVKLATIYDDTNMEAVFNIADVLYQQLIAPIGTDKKLYRSVPLKFESELKHQYSADLYYTSPDVDKNTGTFILKGKIANPENELKDGMFVSVSLPYGTEPHAILVRDASIGTDQLGKYLYVVNDSDKVVYTPIETGELYQDTLRIVTKGLTPKSRYVTKALLTVRNGEKIKPRLVK